MNIILLFLFIEAYELKPQQQTVEVIGTLLVARKRKGVFSRQTLALEYEGCRKAYST